MQYNLLDPLVEVFDDVEELQHLGDAAQDSYSEAQLINFPLQIVKNTHDFETGIRTWIELPRASKSWVRFKTPFESAHRSLRKIRRNTIRSSSFNQVNMILAEVNDVQESVLSAIAKASEPIIDEEQAPDENQQINRVTNTAEQVQLEMLKAIKDLQLELKGLKNTNPPNNPTPNLLKAKCMTRTNTPKYCHRHGACAHKGKFCKGKRTGHKDNATFDNKMGGSTAYCQACA